MICNDKSDSYMIGGIKYREKKVAEKKRQPF